MLRVCHLNVTFALLICYLSKLSNKTYNQLQRNSMTTTKPKEPVRLRTKSLANGNRSLYLDIYIDGARRYEFLKLYLVPEKSREDKERNRETYALANSIKAQRIVEIQAGKYGFTNPQADKILFLRIC